MAMKERIILTRSNYYLLLIAVGLIVSGYLLMTGKPNTHAHLFNEEIYSFRRITLAPVVLLAGYLLIIPAIMWNPKINSNNGKSLNGKI